jgi:hypothetical protein
MSLPSVAAEVVVVLVDVVGQVVVARVVKLSHRRTRQ